MFVLPVTMGVAHGWYITGLSGLSVCGLFLFRRDSCLTNHCICYPVVLVPNKIKKTAALQQQMSGMCLQLTDGLLFAPALPFEAEFVLLKTFYWDF